MRGDIVYHVYGVQTGRAQDMHHGTFATRSAAEEQIRKILDFWLLHPQVAEVHGKDLIIREAAVEVDFTIPPKPRPRDRYAITVTEIKPEPVDFYKIRVDVFRRTPTGGEQICSYKRNYGILNTFEPFRQGGRDFALISSRANRTAVLDLATGAVVAEEADPITRGFFPVGFYVPDWWDVHDGSIIPGHPSWNADMEWPCGAFGFVWGCHWGDDNSWKVQLLDLSRVLEGVIARSERFGYVELETSGFTCPHLESTTGHPPPSFIRVERDDGEIKVRFAVAMEFDLASGAPDRWRRI